MCEPSIKRLLVHGDNQAVVSVIKEMFSALPALMADFRTLCKFLHALRVKIEALWFPSSVNRLADALLWTWGPGYIRASRLLLQLVPQQYCIDVPAFKLRPMKKPLQERLNMFKYQLNQSWDDGRSLLWNPPFDFSPIVVRNIEQKSAPGIFSAHDGQLILVSCSFRGSRHE